MSKWKMVKLSDVFTLQMGKTPSRDNPDYWNGSHKWASIADLGKAEKYICDTKESITDSAISETGIKATHKGTVVMSFKLSIGKTAIAAEDIYTNEAIMSFIDRQTYSYDIDYIYHLFSGKDWSEGTNKAVKGVTLNKATLSQIIIPLPPIETQRQIAENLDKVTRFIDLCNSILYRLDLLVKSRFVEMFGDVFDNSQRFKAVTLQTLIDDGDIIYHLDGNHGSNYPRNEEFTETGVPYIGANCISNGNVDFKLAKYLSQERAARLRKGVAQNNDVLFAHNATVGPVAVLRTQEPKVILSTSLTAYRCNTDIINPYYLCAYMKSDGFVKQYSSDMKQTTRNQVPITAQRKYFFMIPMLDLQDQFASFVEQTDKSKSAVKQVLGKAETLKKALMQKYFEKVERK